MFLQFLRLDGKAFHTADPAWEEARPPTHVLSQEVREGLAFGLCFSTLLSCS